MTRQIYTITREPTQFPVCCFRLELVLQKTLLFMCFNTPARAQVASFLRFSRSHKIICTVQRIHSQCTHRISQPQYLSNQIKQKIISQPHTLYTAYYAILTSHLYYNYHTVLNIISKYRLTHQNINIVYLRHQMYIFTTYV